MKDFSSIVYSHELIRIDGKVGGVNMTRQSHDSELKSHLPLARDKLQYLGSR